MSDPWEEAWAEAQAAVPANIVELETLELYHPSFLVDGVETPVRAVNDTDDHVLTLEGSAPFNPGAAVTFTRVPFSALKPEIEEGKVPELTIRIDNIGRELLPYLPAATQVQAPISVIYRLYLFDTTDGTTSLGRDPVSFQLRNCTVTDTYVEGKVSPADLASIRGMMLVYDLANYPALDLAG